MKEARAQTHMASNHTLTCLKTWHVPPKLPPVIRAQWLMAFSFMFPQSFVTPPSFFNPSALHCVNLGLTHILSQPRHSTIPRGWWWWCLTPLTYPFAPHSFPFGAPVLQIILPILMCSSWGTCAVGSPPLSSHLYIAETLNLLSQPLSLEASNLRYF